MSSKIVSSIYSQIRSKILLSGPITVAEYMKMALTTQQQSVALNSSGKADGGGGLGLGYYMGKDVFGQQGDFITSPEISQLFGEVRLLPVILK
jgi:NADH dehydrogenase [ubiquinone] 1 alpha subcomplex assembly factor 7